MVNALSRYADVQICEACGMDEALRDAAHAPLPLTEWDAVKRGRLPAPAKGRVCYLKTSCTFEEVFQHTDTPPMQLTGRPVSEVVYSRSDYDGYRWWTTWHNVPGKKPAPELVKEIDEFQNALFKLPAFKTLDTMRRFCRYAQATSEAGITMSMFTITIRRLLEVSNAAEILRQAWYRNSSRNAAAP